MSFRDLIACPFASYIDTNTGYYCGLFFNTKCCQVKAKKEKWSRKHMSIEVDEK